MESPTEVVEASVVRKRKIDSLLDILDRSRYIPSSSPSKDSTFAPWDRFSLSSRLVTFRQYFKHALESPINALTCARFGWTYRGGTMIECVYCHSRIAILVDTKVAAAHLELERRYGEMLTSRHTVSCPWAHRQCDVTVLRLPLADSQMSLASMNERTESFTHAVLPQVKVSNNKDAAAAGTVLPDSMSQDERYALFGWVLEKQAELTLIICRDCHRRVRPTDESFDLKAEHCPYCPWIHSLTQGKDPGFQLLLNHYKAKVNANANATPESTDSRPIATQPPSHSDNDNEDSRERVRQVKRKLGFS